jgi:hypothetical protein
MLYSIVFILSWSVASCLCMWVYDKLIVIFWKRLHLKFVLNVCETEYCVDTCCVEHDGCVHQNCQEKSSPYTFIIVHADRAIDKLYVQCQVCFKVGEVVPVVASDPVGSS